jgi:hypothetical protein
MFSSQTSHFFIICLDSVCCDGGKTVENPPPEATPDFVYKPCKGFQATVIEESQKEEEAGLALCTFPVPCNYVCSRGLCTPILDGADAGQPRSVGHSLADLEAKFVVHQVVGILPAPRNEILFQ